MSLTGPRKLSELCFKKHTVLFTAIRNHWNKDYKPAPYPMTMEQRMKSAKKYGLSMEDYQTYPDNGVSYGDYPKLPDISGEAKDPHYPWDNPELKRNFNEPLHADFDMIGEDRYDVSFRHRIPVTTQFLQFMGVMLGTFGLYYFLENMKMFPGLIPKQYPHQGKVHYKLEPKE